MYDSNPLPLQQPIVIKTDYGIRLLDVAIQIKQKMEQLNNIYALFLKRKNYIIMQTDNGNIYPCLSNVMDMNVITNNTFKVSRDAIYQAIQLTTSHEKKVKYYNTYLNELINISFIPDETFVLPMLTKSNFITTMFSYYSEHKCVSLYYKYTSLFTIPPEMEILFKLILYQIIMIQYWKFLSVNENIIEFTHYFRSGNYTQHTTMINNLFKKMMPIKMTTKYYTFE